MEVFSEQLDNLILSPEPMAEGENNPPKVVLWPPPPPAICTPAFSRKHNNKMKERRNNLPQPEFSHSTQNTTAVQGATLHGQQDLNQVALLTASQSCYRRHFPPGDSDRNPRTGISNTKSGSSPHGFPVLLEGTEDIFQLEMMIDTHWQGSWTHWSTDILYFTNGKKTSSTVRAAR